MTKLFERKSTSLTISEFYDNYQAKKYNFDVSYQRKSDIWSADKKSFLIDSILKNYPMPAIFLRPSINTENGKTVYDVVDGKQRLETIVAFIENKIPLTSYFAEDKFIDAQNLEIAREIAELYFGEILSKSDKFGDYIRQFWTYTINIEYLYERDDYLVATVFDRLNRNGEPLTRQELRKAKYANSVLLKAVDKLADSPFWKDKLGRLKSTRMEDIEFISELFFIILTDKINDSNQGELDNLYEEYANSEREIAKAEIKFNEVVDYMSKWKLDFNKYKRLCWTTHLYTLFSLAWKMEKLNVNSRNVTSKIKSFYREYFSKTTRYEGQLQIYKDASSSRTRSAGQREKRLNALLAFCQVQ